MSLTITQIKNRLARKFRGSSLDDIQGISDYTLFAEAANNLLSRIDPLETIRHGELNVYKEVYDYGLSSAAPDLKGRKVVDLRPQVDRNHADNFRQVRIEDIDRDKDNQTLSVEYDEGTKFLRVVDKTLSRAIGVTSTDSDDYTAGTGVSNIAEDTVIFSEGGKSIRFDVSSGSNLITWAGTAVDLSTHTQKSSFFAWVYLPDASIISSIKARVGSGASDYYEITGTVHFGSTRNGWNLYRFDWDGVSDAGTTDEANTDYVRYEITTTSADTDIRVGTLTSKLPYPRELVYYSKNLFKSSAGTYLNLPTAETDVLQLDTDAENIFFYECCEIIAGDMSDTEKQKEFRKMLGVDDFGRETGGGLYADYRADKPSEAMKTQTSYNRTYRTRLGR